MKLFKKSKEFLKKVFNSKDMETDDVEPSDLLCYITEELQTRYQGTTDIAEQSQIFQDFLKRWEGDTALDVLRKQKFEFEKGELQSGLCFHFSLKS